MTKTKNNNRNSSISAFNKLKDSNNKKKKEVYRKKNEKMSKELDKLLKNMKIY